MHFFESAGFGGLCAVLAGTLAYLAARGANAERRRNDDLARWWDRFTWTADNVPSDDELLYRLLARLSDAANRLGDPALIEYMQEFTLEAASEAFGGESHWAVTPRDEGAVDGDR
jgi:hypothetical protein